MKKVGIVQQINLYPVKSMRGVSLEKATCYWYGINGDRKFAFIHQDGKTGFPWVTARDIPQLLQYQPEFVTPEDPMKSPVFVASPSGKRMALDSQELTKELLDIYGKPIALLKLNRGTFDCMPITLLTQTSIDAIQSKLPYNVDTRRFRANIIVKTETSQQFPELRWTDSLVSFGQRPDSAQIQINYPAKRCVVVNLDPETGDSNPDFLKTIIKKTNGYFSMYASLKRLGTIEVGDAIFLQE